MKKVFICLASLAAVFATACGTQGGPSTVESTSIRDVHEIPTEDGYFEYVAPDGTEYIGDFVNGLYDGLGKIYYTDGTSYVGQFSEGIREGTGTIYWNTGCVYIGEMKNDLMHGDGYMSWPCGDYYQGKWKNGRLNGYGTKCFLIDITGETYREQYNTYVGYFVDDLMDGKGIMTYTFGGVYDGFWKEGVRYGYGRYIWEETDNPDIPWKMFEGNFVDDINGEGTLYFRDGTYLTGSFRGDSLPLSSH